MFGDLDQPGRKWAEENGLADHSRVKREQKAAAEIARTATLRDRISLKSCSFGEKPVGENVAPSEDAGSG